MSLMRIAVTGKNGQVVTALKERAVGLAEILPVGLPEVDIANRDQVSDAFASLGCDLIVSAAAYTAVDKAEKEPERAMSVNMAGAQYVAETAAALRIPLLHLSTDYVFDGKLDRPYCETDAVGPQGVYGRSKLLGERRISERLDHYMILRTAWIHSPFGANFVKTMLRVAESRHEVSVVSDQVGSPTSALDIADALLVLARRWINRPKDCLAGVFHMAGAGEASWADLAQTAFEIAALHGFAVPNVKRISTAEYPTPAARPANSRLDTRKLEATYGVALPDWRPSLALVVNRLCAQAR